ncbi:MAG: FISUMP domain-containing protein [Paludibacter sp.]|nr:FISUMP domain-containing protein [Paludibacter sp.]
MIKINFYKILSIVTIIFFLFSCNKTTDLDQLPEVNIDLINNVTNVSASCLVDVLKDNGLSVTERGVCWANNSIPTIKSDSIVSGNGMGDFTVKLENLTPGQTYYVRAFATNKNGTSYSKVLQITTLSDDNISTNIFNSNLTYGNLTDIDGNVYKTIVIGTQTWMAENLRVTKYRNGDAIPNVTINSTWHTLLKGAQCSYNNNIETNSINKFGRLYNYYAVVDSRNLAPNGWHIPTDAEWTRLEDYLESKLTKTDSKAKSLTSSTDWPSSLTVGTVGYLDPATNALLNNSTGFSALPAGIRFYCGCSNYVTTFTAWWSSSKYDGTSAFFRSLNYNSSAIGRNYYDKVFGLSIRCVKD